MTMQPNQINLFNMARKYTTHAAKGRPVISKKLIKKWAELLKKKRAAESPNHKATN